MTYLIRHRTVYEYVEPVSVSHHSARLQPRAVDTQQCERTMLDINPAPAVRTERMDYFGNHVCFFSIQGQHSRLEITAESRVIVSPWLKPEPSRTPPWETVAARFRDPVARALLEPCQYVFDSPLVRRSPALARFAGESFPAGRPLLEGVLDLNGRIHREFRFDAKATTVSTPLEQVLEKRHGVCQDFAHLAIGGLRSLGLPARYVSGYLRTRPPEGKERLIGADYSHAWASVFCPGFGWVDFDPTNNLVPDVEHIVMAYGRDFSDVSPVTGVILGGGEHQVRVGVDVDVV